MGNRRTLFLIDSNSRRRYAICRILSESQIYVEPFESVEELRAFKPRVGVVMLADSSEDLAALLGGMAERDRWLPIVCFSEAPTPQQVARTVLDGATGYVPWPCPPEELAAAMDDAEVRSAGAASFKLRRTRALSRLERLTPRERQILDAVTDGLSNREIGERLAISTRTVEIHRCNMLNKVGARHTSEAIRIAIEASLVGQS
jgi:DNA-binding NarL/FixJ family response regulator